MSDREAPEAELWETPEWMKPYEGQIFGHGGNGVADLMNRLRQESNLAFSNSVVFTMACEVSAQVGLLSRLREEGLLRGCPMREMEVIKVTSVDGLGRAIFTPSCPNHWLGAEVVRVVDVEEWLEGYDYYDGDEMRFDDDGLPYTMADRWGGLV